MEALHKVATRVVAWSVRLLDLQAVAQVVLETVLKRFPHVAVDPIGTAELGYPGLNELVGHDLSFLTRDGMCDCKLAPTISHSEYIPVPFGRFR